MSECRSRSVSHGCRLIGPSTPFKHVADGTLNQVTPLVAELCEKWRQRDPRLPITGVITVLPGIELDLNGCAGDINRLGEPYREPDELLRNRRVQRFRE